jgi:molybdenum cofactor biosynthesis enzyme MoaA
LVGGPIEAVDSQIRTVQAMLRGDAQVDGAPLSVCLTVTSFCNYDCLMCPLGEEGVLDDQLTPMFYQALRPMLAGVQVLEVNGGEPMASPHFRSFLEQLDRRDLPQLRVNMISNGSYLGEKQLQKLRHVPWGNLTLSLNAASADAYRLVNRGLDFARIRSNLDALAALRRAGELQTQLTYSLVVLKQNVAEIGRLAEMAAQDGAGVRLMLPFRDRHQSSVLTDRAAMIEALQAMQALTRQLQERGRGREARGVLAQARVLWERLDRGLLSPL